MNKSWKTTVTGFGSILVAVIGAIITVTDGNPATNPDWTAVIAAITAGFGLIAARDNGVSTEEARAK